MPPPEGSAVQWKSLPRVAPEGKLFHTLSTGCPQLVDNAKTHPAKKFFRRPFFFLHLRSHLR